MGFALILGAIFAPVPAYAGLFSIFGVPAAAQTDLAAPDLTSNSQSMDLLQADISPTNILAEKAAKKDPKKEPLIDESAEVSISENALMPAVTPLGDEVEAIGGDLSFEDVSVYVVRSGDTVAQVAEMFGVTPDTILSANDMKKGDKLKEGDVLLILPFSGVEHTVAKGETLQGIANKYKVDIDDILFYNDLESSSKIAIGEKLMIPGGTLLDGAPKSGGGSGSNIAVKPVPYPKTSVKNVNGYFINPVPNGVRTRGTNATHKGVDIGAKTGTPIYAAASGRVTFARNGYNGGFGNLVIISHPNGTETLYAHQSKIATSVGAQVNQGDIIGYVGSTGRSTGPHLHFEVHGAKNPGNDWSWKY